MRVGPSEPVYRDRFQTAFGGFVREQLKDSYSETGRPSIDPELLLRILLIGYLYGITSERKLVEELRMHLAWRWFTGLGFDQEIPHHSTFSKNRHGRFQESKLSSGWRNRTGCPFCRAEHSQVWHWTVACRILRRGRTQARVHGAPCNR